MGVTNEVLLHNTWWLDQKKGLVKSSTCFIFYNRYKALVKVNKTVLSSFNFVCLYGSIECFWFTLLSYTEV